MRFGGKGRQVSFPAGINLQRAALHNLCKQDLISLGLKIGLNVACEILFDIIY